uniref:Large ribosomal subunit protein eL28 n=1 Tax=Seriola lalandi dorsalis TaxID=1841481 RepID=A0A3B4XIB5_SERLL
MRTFFTSVTPFSASSSNNVSGVNSFKYSGLVNAKTVSLEEAEKGVTLVKKVRKADRLNKPNKMYNKVSLTKDFRRVASAIKKETGDNFYRPDLTKAALAKWSLIHKAQKRGKRDRAGWASLSS